MKLLLTTIKTDCNYTDYAMRYLYSVVDESPLDVDMKTYGRYELEGHIFEDIIRGEYDIVYFHCNAFNERRICNVIEMIKKAVPATAVMVGGNQVSFETRLFMRANPWVDYVIRGEGESVLFRFLKSVYDGEYDFESIPGLAFRNEEGIVVNGFDDPIDLSDLPFPYEKTEVPENVIYYESMRGDAEILAYEPFIPGSMVRALDIERVFTEIRYFLVKKPEKVIFFDKCFNFNSERAYKIFEYLISNDNLVTTFVFNVSGENLDDETIRLLSGARAGLFEFNIDVGSTNPEVLAAVGRKENIYQLMYNVTKLLQGKKVKVNISVIAGLPYESEEMFERSFNKAYGLGEGSPLKVRMLRLSKGTGLRAAADDFGYLFTSEPPYDLIATEEMSAHDIIRIRTVSRVVEAFIGDGSFDTAFPQIIKDLSIKPFDLMSKLTDYIYSQGLAGRLNSKDNLARILFAFARDLYQDAGCESGFDALTEAIHNDLEKAVPEDELRKFEMKGWEFQNN